MVSTLIKDVYRKNVPTRMREGIFDLREHCRRMALSMKLVPIQVDACLQGGDNGNSSAAFARMVGDIRRASRPISEWPHVKLLRQYDSIGERIWEREVFEATNYFGNAKLNIEMCGNYHGAVTPDEVRCGVRSFVNAYRGIREALPRPRYLTYERDHEYIKVHPVMDSNCYQVCEGHHRLSIAYLKGVREVRGIIGKPPLMTPVQELLLDVQWMKGRRELYQPVDSPEVNGWVLVRRCSDRLAKMTRLLRAEGLMPPASCSYLDVASSYGWFVSEMSRAEFRAEGVERDPNAILVGKVMYGLRPDQVHRSDVVSFLRSLQDKYDVTSCFSLAHHFLLNRSNVSAEDLLHLLDSATGRVMFFDMGQSHEYPGEKLQGWDPDHIHQWLEANTTFKRIVRLGPDNDAVPPNQNNFGRMLFACLR